MWFWFLLGEGGVLKANRQNWQFIILLKETQKDGNSPILLSPATKPKKERKKKNLNSYQSHLHKIISFMCSVFSMYIGKNINQIIQMVSTKANLILSPKLTGFEQFQNISLSYEKVSKYLTFPTQHKTLLQSKNIFTKREMFASRLGVLLCKNVSSISGFKGWLPVSSRMAVDFFAVT